MDRRASIAQRVTAQMFEKQAASRAAVKRWVEHNLHTYNTSRGFDRDGLFAAMEDRFGPMREGHEDIIDEVYEDLNRGQRTVRRVLGRLARGPVPAGEDVAEFHVRKLQQTVREAALLVNDAVYLAQGVERAKRDSRLNLSGILKDDHKLRTLARTLTSIDQDMADSLSVLGIVPLPVRLANRRQ